MAAGGRRRHARRLRAGYPGQAGYEIVARLGSAVTASPLARAGVPASSRGGRHGPELNLVVGEGPRLGARSRVLRWPPPVLPRPPLRQPRPSVAQRSGKRRHLRQQVPEMLSDGPLLGLRGISSVALPPGLAGGRAAPRECVRSA